MAEIAVAPILMEDCIISIDGDDYAAAISAATLTPSTPSPVEFRGLKKESVHRFIAAATWTFGITFAQDSVTATSLTRYLLEHEGEIVPAILKPQSGVGPSYSADIVVTPGALGGTVGQVPTSTVNLPVQGKPLLVPAA